MVGIIDVHTYAVISSINSVLFIFYNSYLKYIFNFYSGTSNSLVNRSNGRQFYLVSLHKRNFLLLFQVQRVCCRLFVVTLCKNGHFSSISILLRGFAKGRCWILSNALLTAIEMNIGLLF